MSGTTALNANSVYPNGGVIAPSVMLTRNKSQKNYKGVFKKKSKKLVAESI